MKAVIDTPAQKIKVVVGLHGAPSYGRLIDEDSTLMDMDAPEVMPAGSSVPSFPENVVLRRFTRESWVFRGGWK